MAPQPDFILIVDDSAINRRMLEDQLKSQGYRTKTAIHGKEALEILWNEHPDLILLDILMPEMNGLQLCRLLKEQPSTRDIPVIFISSLDDTADKLSGFEAGGVDYITKPFHPSEVLARVDTHLKLCRLQRQLEEKNRQLAEEKQKSEALLLTVLPAGVAKELMETGHCTPQCFPEVTVCFVDIVDFTKASSDLAPEVVINELNGLFSAFDRIAEEHGCDRMKTIGDAYLCVCGMSEDSVDHAQAIADTALAMISHLTLRNKDAQRKWQVRIGVHCGPVVGGIVGTKKYLYDIFGDTVNIAARLERLAKPMTINVSSEVYLSLGKGYVFSEPTEVDIKGKGKRATWLLEGHQPI